MIPRTRKKYPLLPICLVVLAIALAFGAFASTGKGAAFGPTPAVVTAPIVQTTGGTTAPPRTTTSKGSIGDTLEAEFRLPHDPELTHRIVTTRLPDETDEVFFKRHVERVVAFRRVLRGM